MAALERKDDEVSVVTFTPTRSFIGETGVLKVTCRTNCGVKSESSAVVEILTHRDGSAILHVSTDELFNFQHWLTVTLQEVDRVLYDYDKRG
jgi:hypothetical protein